jgi:hypothetical protein
MVLFFLAAFPITVFFLCKILEYVYIENENYETLMAAAKDYIETTFKPFFNYNHKPLPMIKFIENGKEIAEFILSGDAVPPHYDFVLHEIPAAKNDYLYDKYILRYEDHNNVKQIEYSAENDFNLFTVQIILNENINDIIRFNVGKNHFFINGNRLFDRKFVQWYLNVYHDIQLNTADTYIVTFIDHNMNYIVLDEHDYIVIKQNKYDIIRTKQNRIENSEELVSSSGEGEDDVEDEGEDEEEYDEKKEALAAAEVLIALAEVQSEALAQALADLKTEYVD